MRLLIIGNSGAAQILTNFLSKDENRLVFTTKEGIGGNFVNISPYDIEELKEFALANEINLTIVADNALFEEKYASSLNSVFNENGLAIFIPDFEALKITTSKSFCKKFIYKNKVPTPKFAFFDKSPQAIEYVKNLGTYPLVIKPDTHSETETAYIAETFSAAKRQIEKLFQRDNKKVLIEEYIYGKEVSAYALSDGFNPIIVDFCLNYRNDISVKGALNKELEEKIYKEIILPVISSLASSETEYVGLMGFDVIVTPENKVFLLECNPFFKDIDTEIMLQGTEEDWTKLFMDAITGALTSNFETPFSIKKSDGFFGAARLQNSEMPAGEEIITAEARTVNMLKAKLLEEGMDKKELLEAENFWKI